MTKYKMTIMTDPILERCPQSKTTSTPDKNDNDQIQNDNHDRPEPGALPPSSASTAFLFAMVK
jgi:hypothetical protein